MKGGGEGDLERRDGGRRVWGGDGEVRMMKKVYNTQSPESWV